MKQVWFNAWLPGIVVGLLFWWIARMSPGEQEVAVVKVAIVAALLTLNIQLRIIPALGAYWLGFARDLLGMTWLQRLSSVVYGWAFVQVAMELADKGGPFYYVLAVVIDVLMLLALVALMIVVDKRARPTRGRSSRDLPNS